MRRKISCLLHFYSAMSYSLYFLFFVTIICIDIVCCDIVFAFIVLLTLFVLYLILFESRAFPQNLNVVGRYFLIILCCKHSGSSVKLLLCYLLRYVWYLVISECDEISLHLLKAFLCHLATYQRRQVRSFSPILIACVERCERN